MADSSRCWRRNRNKLMDREWLGKSGPNWERMPKDEEMAFQQDQNNKRLVVQRPGGIMFQAEGMEGVRALR